MKLLLLVNKNEIISVINYNSITDEIYEYSSGKYSNITKITEVYNSVTPVSKIIEEYKQPGYYLITYIDKAFIVKIYSKYSWLFTLYNEYEIIEELNIVTYNLTYNSGNNLLEILFLKFNDLILNLNLNLNVNLNKNLNENLNENLN